MGFFRESEHVMKFSHCQRRWKDVMKFNLLSELSLEHPQQKTKDGLNVSLGPSNVNSNINEYKIGEIC